MTTLGSVVPTIYNLPIDDTHLNCDLKPDPMITLDPSSPSSTNNMEAAQPLIVYSQTNVSQPIPSTLNSNACVVYGVDWSDRARPTSHCWFPITSDDSFSVEQCAYVSCTNETPIYQSTLLQCGSCALIVHSHHLNDLQAAKADFLPPCRLSFVDSEDNQSKYDQHFWSHVSLLPKPCAYCQHISMATNLFEREYSRLSTMSALDIMDHVTSVIGNLNSTISESSDGLICLWCSRGYHRSCWELVAEDDKIQCDYGIFQKIIVRPQWLSRCSESPTGFRARLPPYLVNNKPELNSFLYAPVVLFINKRSGGQIGEKIYRELLQKLNPRQVFLIENNATITHALDTYASLPNTRICVFGGDGTVGWILGRLAEIYPSRNNPPVSICPLGTGNDLSRVLAWGEQYDPERLFDTLVRIPQAQVVVLDRWQVQLEQNDKSTLISPVEQHYESGFQFGRIFQPVSNHPKFVYESNRALYSNHHELPNTRFINYMSFGLDAAIALDFHDQRTRDPSKFSSPWKNKLLYLSESSKYLNDFARAHTWDLSTYLRLICDGHDLTDATRECHTLIVLNIPGYAAGTNPWGSNRSNDSQLQVLQQQSDLYGLFNALIGTYETNEATTVNDCSMDQTTASPTTIISSERFKQQDFGDQIIEVVGLSTTHMATIHAGFCGKRIAQCNQLRIELCCPMTAQIDGEPFYLPASVAVNISHAGQVLVLKNDNK